MFALANLFALLLTDISVVLLLIEFDWYDALVRYWRLSICSCAGSIESSNEADKSFNNVEDPTVKLLLAPVEPTVVVMILVGMSRLGFDERVNGDLGRRLRKSRPGLRALSLVAFFDLSSTGC